MVSPLEMYSKFGLANWICSAKWGKLVGKWPIQLIRYNELAKLIVVSGSFTKLHYNDMYSYVVKASVKFCTLH